MDKERNLIRRMAMLYVDGFKGMGGLGKALWALILVKLVLIFLVMKLIFFPNFLGNNFDTDTERAQYVRKVLASPDSVATANNEIQKNN